jgi:hypothetical protein
MRPISAFALILSLAASPVLAGMIQVQEADEAATCELRGASLVTPAPDNSVLFPQQANCVDAELESGERSKEAGASAVENAGYSPAAGQ